MNHDELSDLLHTLPRTEASHGFTTRVIAKVTERPSPMPVPRYRFAIAAVLVAMLTTLSVVGTKVVERQHERARIAQLRNERQQIEKELNELKAMSKAADPVVYLGSANGVDLVVDVSKVKPAAVPAKEEPVALVVADDGAL